MYFTTFSSTVSHSIPPNAKYQLWSVSAAAGAVASTLPDATKCPGTVVCVVKTEASGNAVTVTPFGSQKILNASGLVSTFALAAIGKSITMVCDGANWVQIASV